MHDLTVWYDLGGRALVAISPLLVAALSVLSLKGVQLLQAKVKNEYLQGVLVRLDDAVFTAVCEVQQVLVDKLKAETANGHLDEAARARIRTAALETIRAYFGPKGLAEVGRVLGITPEDVDRHLASRLEATVFELRRGLVLNGHNPGPATVSS